MLFSHRFQFLFVHIPKTGGTSVRTALARIRYRDPLYIPQFVCNCLSHLTRHRIGAKLPRHAAAITAKEILPAQFDQLFKFTFVRNPWDRHVSAYEHFVREQKQILDANNIRTFDEFSRWLLVDAEIYQGPKPVLIAAVRRSQFEYVIDLSGRVIVDFVARFDRLIEDFEFVQRRIGVTPVKLPHKRKAKNRKDYRCYYTDETAQLVGDYYRRDIENFDYSFGTSAETEETLLPFRDPARKELQLLDSA